MDICFYGVGGVGGYFGAHLAKNYEKDDDISVHFVARGKHKDAIVQNGLLLKKSGGEQSVSAWPSTCTDSIQELPHCDVIVLSVKGYDLESAVKAISKMTSANTVILPLLNGVDIYERIRSELTAGIVLPACVYVGTHIESPGVIYQKGGSCRIQVGKDPLFPNFYPAQLMEMFKASGIEIEWHEEISTTLWTKYMFIASFGLVTAAYGKTIGEILADVSLSAVAKSIMDEIYEIARHRKIILPENIRDESFSMAGQFPYETKTSLQRDVESKGALNEGDLFGGTLIRFGEELDMEIPETEKTYKKLLRRQSTR